MTRCSALLLAFLFGCTSTRPTTRIVVERAEVLRGSTGDGGFEGFVLVSAPMPDGRRVAIRPDTPSPGPVLILGADGLIADTLAMPGEGPDQIQGARRLLVGRGDTLFVFARSKVHVFSPELLPVRTFPIPVFAVWTTVQIGTGDLALSSATYGDDEPVVVVSAVDGSKRWAVPGPGLGAPATSPGPIRLVAAGPDGSLWIASMTQRLEFFHYNAAGALLDSVVVQREWFPERAPGRPPTRSEPPSAYLSGFWLDSLGSIWVVARGLDPDWKNAEGEEVVGEGGATYFAPKRQMDVMDGVIEVIDRGTGDTRGILRTDSLFGMVQAPWILSEFPADEDGWVQVVLSRVRGQF